MNTLHLVCQLIIGLGILNVWFLRAKKKTSYRGGDANSLKEEFAAYGLPGRVFLIVGIFKVGAALALLVGIFVPELVRPGALVMAVLMAGAVVVHVKVNDRPMKSLPAAIVLGLSLLLIFT